MTINVILLTGKKLETSKKIKDESPVEPSFKVLKYTPLFRKVCILNAVLIE